MNHSLVSSFKSAVLIIAALLGLLAVAQAHAWEGDLGGNQYGAPEARRYQRVQVGVVEDIREVVVTRESQSAGYIGGAVGAILGGVAGNTAGNGKGPWIFGTSSWSMGASGVVSTIRMSAYHTQLSPSESS